MFVSLQHYRKHLYMSFIKDFKEFAMRGNVVDMAIGVIIGGAFGKIVTSLVNDIIMPAIGVLTGGANFSEFKYVMKPAVVDAVSGETVTPEAAITWGVFVQTIVDFLIIALCIFMAIRLMNKLTRKQKQEEAAPAPAGPTQEELLAEIRDLLKEKK